MAEISRSSETTSPLIEAINSLILSLSIPPNTPPPPYSFAQKESSVQVNYLSDLIDYLHFVIYYVSLFPSFPDDEQDMIEKFLSDAHHQKDIKFLYLKIKDFIFKNALASLPVLFSHDQGHYCVFNANPLDTVVCQCGTDHCQINAGIPPKELRNLLQIWDDNEFYGIQSGDFYIDIHDSQKSYITITPYTRDFCNSSHDDNSDSIPHCDFHASGQNGSENYYCKCSDSECMELYDMCK